MNKKEQAEMNALKMELALAKALRFTELVLPDIPEPKPGDALVPGYRYNAYYQNPRVEPSCSTGTSHGFGTNTQTISQRPIEQYSTRLLALKALRNEMEIQCAKLLAGIDLKIQQEMDAINDSDA